MPTPKQQLVMPILMAQCNACGKIAPLAYQQVTNQNCGPELGK
jgi:hypothetical protein